MKMRHSLPAGALLLLAGALVSCVLPNTATLHLKNTTGHTITPGTYDITLTVEGYGNYVAFAGLALEKNHWVYKNTPALP